MSEKDQILALIAKTNINDFGQCSGRDFHEDIELFDLKILKNFTFIRCVFHSDIKFSNIILSSNLTFSNCKFNNGIQFNKINENHANTGVINFFAGELNYLSLNESNILSLTMRDVSGLTEFININSSLINTIYLYSIKSIKSFGLQDLIVKRFDVIQSNLIKHFHEKNCEIEEFSLNTCTFDCALIFSKNFKSKTFNIDDCDFNNYTFIDGPTFSNASDGTLAINHSRFKKEFIYHYSKITNQNLIGHKTFIFNNNIVGGTFEVMSYQELDTKNINNLLLHDYKPLLKKFSIIFSTRNEGSFKVQNITAESLSISGTNSKSYLQLEQINAKDFSFNDFINLGNVSLINCFNNLELFSSEKKTLKIKGSLINNLTFLNTNLNSFNKVDIRESSLMNLKANNTKFFSYENLIGEGLFKDRGLIVTSIRGFLFMFFNTRNNGEVIFLQNKREVYKQLKLSMEQSGDKIQSLEFKASEMKAYLHYLTLTRKIWDQERLILALSSLNDFGLNWKKALKWCIITMLSFYSIILIQTHPNLYFHFNPTTLKYTTREFIDKFDIFYQLLNPIHDVKKVFDSQFEISNTTYFLDYLSRIAISFFIFQIVSAFRKYVK